MIKAAHKTTIKLGNNFLTPNVIGRNNLTELDCIAELVANCLDWRITKVDPTATTTILIEVSEDSIKITDNGVGMTVSELDKAIDLGESGDDIRQKLDDEERKGMYGLGMKVAVLSLGWKLAIHTVSINDPGTELQFYFDSRKLTDKKSKYLEELTINELKKTNLSPLKNFNSGTAILVEDLVKEVSSIVALGKDLEERFSPDINNLIDEGKLNFQIQGEDGTHYTIKKVDIGAKFEDEILKLDFENPTKWAKRKEYKYTGADGKEYTLKGFIQLLKARSVVQQSFGLNLYCKGQLIERFHKDNDNGGLFTIAGRSGEKTYGELHLDGCLPDNVKANGFIREKAFQSIRDLIRDDLEVYKYLTPTSAAGGQRIRDEINKRKGIGSTDNLPPPHTKNKNNETGKEEDLPTTEPDIPLPEGTIKISNKLYIQVNKAWVHEKGLDTKRNVSWEPLYLKSKVNNDLYELQLYINPKSNLYQAILELYSNKADQNKMLSFFKKLAISESINQKLITDHNYTPEDAREITDELVYPSVLKMKLD